jgi:hypothetical protein
MKKMPSVLEILKEFEKINSLGYREIATLLPRDRIPIGLFCPYVSEELIQGIR